MRLSGTFGELRSGHFHTGIDIKSAKGMSGDPILAVDEGFVSRIKVGAGGYGNALYIDHPGGLTSVYAHLLAFTPHLDSLVRVYQHELRSFEIDISPLLPKVPIAKGQRIGTLGSTGHSMGPHLHFELRNTLTETPINPLLHFNIADEKAPVIRQVAIYHLDHNLQSYRKSDVRKQSDWIIGDTIVVDAWRMGLGVDAIDPHNGHANKNGIYQVVLTLDGDTIFHSTLDSIPWDAGTFYPIFIDHAEALLRGRKVQKCFDSQAQSKAYHSQLKDHGIIALYRDKTQKVMLTVTDFYGNDSRASFWVRRAAEITPVVYEPHHFLIEQGTPFRIDTGGLLAFFPAQALYERLRCKIKIEPKEGSTLMHSRRYHLHSPSTPLRQPIHISLRTHSIDAKLKDQAVVVDYTNPESPFAIKSKWQGHFLSSQVDHFGTFQVSIDTVQPTISVLRKTVHPTLIKLGFRIVDDLTPPGDLSFEATIDGEWTLGTYDLKARRVNYEIDRTKLADGEHLFEFAVTDISNNSKSYATRLNN